MPLKTQDFNNNLHNISHKYRKKSRKICCLWSGFNLKLWTELFPDQAVPSRKSNHIKRQQRCETNVRRIIVSRLLGAACSSPSCCVEAKTPTRTTSTDRVSLCLLLSVPTLYLFLLSKISETQNTAIVNTHLQLSLLPHTFKLLKPFSLSGGTVIISHLVATFWSHAGVWTMLFSVYLKTIHICAVCRTKGDLQAQINSKTLWNDSACGAEVD